MLNGAASNWDSSRTARITKLLAGSVILLNLLVIGVVTVWLTVSLDKRQNQAGITAQNLAGILSQEINASIEKIDLGLLVSEQEIERTLAKGPIDGESLSAFLGRMQGQLPLVTALRFTDGNGVVKYGTGVPKSPEINVSDREYFIRSRDEPKGELVISKPLISRIDKKWSLNLSRRVNHPDGAFAGLVYTNVELERIIALFSLVDVGRYGSINIRDTDMRLIIHYPPSKSVEASIGDTGISDEFKAQLNAGKTEGYFYTPTSFDNTPRTVSFRKVSRYPLYLTVGLARDDYLVEWRREAQQMSGLGLLFILITTGTGWAVSRGLTAQLEATEKLAREEEKFHTVADYTYDWEYWEGAGHEIFYISPSCERITGYTQEEFVDDPDLLLRIIHPDDRRLMDAHIHGLTNREPAELDFQIVRRDGAVRWVSHSCQAVFGRNGAYMGRRVNNRDVTDRHLFELEITRLSQAVEQNPTGIVITDMHGQVIYTNPAYTRITGYSFADALKKDKRALISSELTDEEYLEIEDCLSSGRPWSGILRNHHRNGELRWEQVSASSIYDHIGNVSNFLYLRTDITDRIRNEEELRSYKDHLEEEVQQRTADLVLARNAAEAANQAKSVFLANMSHELRTPLNAILGFSGMMRKDPQMPESERANLDIINRSGEHLLTLINDVLEMAKIEAGRYQLETAPFDLGGMVRDVVEMMQIRAKAKGIQLLIDQSSRFPRFIVGDEARLRQVLINLLGNAVKFTDDGGVVLRLGTKHNTTSHLLIDVEDSGPGIAGEDQQRIFEPFVQLGGRERNKGTGLGLTITRQFIELMGGTIGLESTVGKGSLFHVSLPLSEVTDADVVKSKEVEKGEVVGLVPGQPEYRILVVEDQLENQTLLVKLMETLGLPTKVAGDGQEAIQLFQTWHPHLIWMDRQMPVMDGLEAMKRIRELPGGNAVKIVAVTASAFSEQRKEMLNAGMDDFVRKPYRFNEIYDCLANQLGVQFIYSGVPVSGEALELTAESLSVLPRGLRKDLTDALTNLDSERISRAIARVAPYDIKLKNALSTFADNFDYPTILKALRTNQ